MANGDELRRRLINSQNLTIIGQARSSGADDENAQRFAIGQFTRRCYDAGYDPTVMIQMFLSGAVWIGEQCGISKEPLIEVIKAAGGPENAEYIYDPKGG